MNSEYFSLSEGKPVEDNVTVVLENEGHEGGVLLLGLERELVVAVGQLENLGKVLDGDAEREDAVGAVLSEALLFEGERDQGDVGGVHRLHGDGGRSGVDVDVVHELLDRVDDLLEDGGLVEACEEHVGRGEFVCVRREIFLYYRTRGS